MKRQSFWKEVAGDYVLYDSYKTDSVNGKIWMGADIIPEAEIILKDLGFLD
jgi:hypothetical protein